MPFRTNGVATARVALPVAAPPVKPFPAVTPVMSPVPTAWHVGAPAASTERIAWPAAHAVAIRFWTVLKLVPSVTAPVVAPPVRPDPMGVSMSVMSPPPVPLSAWQVIVPSALIWRIA